jgi:hypothetical protein
MENSTGEVSEDVGVMERLWPGTGARKSAENPFRDADENAGGISFGR